MVIFLLGLGLGIICGYIVRLLHVTSVGDLRIVYENPNENPYSFLELSRDINYVSRKKVILLVVKHGINTSQK